VLFQVKICLTGTRRDLCFNEVEQQKIKDLQGTVFWVAKPCSPLKVGPRFGGTYTIIIRIEK
jgi:hypothetical protein